MASAVETCREHAFETREKMAAVPHVHTGMFVKVGVRGERFWCRVQHVGVDTLRVVVNNDLLRSPWRCGHDLVVRHEHVLESVDVFDQIKYQCLVSVLGSQRKAAVAWHRLRLAEAAEAAVKVEAAEADVTHALNCHASNSSRCSQKPVL